MLAGRPNAPAPLASFSDWSNLVRGALIWLGYPDPASTMEKAREDDPELAMLRAMLTSWSVDIGFHWQTCAQVVKAIEETERMQLGEPTDYRRPQLREVLHRHFGERHTINTRRLGNWLRTKEGRIAENMRFVRDTALGQGGVTKWKIETV